MRVALNNNATELPINDATIQYLTGSLAAESLGGDEQTRLDGNNTLEEIQEYRERLPDSITFLRDAAAIGNVEIIKPPWRSTSGSRGFRSRGAKPISIDWPRPTCATPFRPIRHSWHG